MMAVAAFDTSILFVERRAAAAAEATVASSSMRFDERVDLRFGAAQPARRAHERCGACGRGLASHRKKPHQMLEDDDCPSTQAPAAAPPPEISDPPPPELSDAEAFEVAFMAEIADFHLALVHDNYLRAQQNQTH